MLVMVRDRVRKLVDDGKSEQEAGLDKPQMLITATSGGKDQTLEVGAQKGEDVYVRARGAAPIYLVKRYLLERATARPIDGFQIPNHDGAGVIDAVGSGVDPGRVGQRVWIWLAAAGRRWGTAAEWTGDPKA